MVAQGRQPHCRLAGRHRLPPMDRPKYLFHFIVLNRFFNFNLSFLEREVGEEHGEGENLKQAPQPVCSPTWGSIS